MTEFAGAGLFPNWRGTSDWQERAAEARDNLDRAFPDLPAIVAAHPFDRFEAVAAAAPPANYSIVPSALAAFVADIPDTLVAPYLCGLLLWLMTGFEMRFRASGLASEFRLHYADAFHRIIDQIRDNPGFAALRKDAFLKDLWLARVVMLPAVALVWWPRSGLRIRDLVLAGPRALAYTYRRCGGRKPLFEGHTHDPMASAGYWNADGWAHSLRLMALALPAFPQHKGAFSIAWYFDPALERVSPRLKFAAALQMDHGAFRFRVGPNDAAGGNALAKSPTRRRMAAEGTYVPTDYGIVWSRQDLIAAYGPQARVTPPTPNIAAR